MSASSNLAIRCSILALHLDTTTMTASHNAARPMARCLCKLQITHRSFGGIRSLQNASPSDAEVAVEAPPVKSALDPNTVTSSREERRLMRTGNFPIGSRRRRAVLRRTPEIIPFELLPYHCFQEARKVLLAERQEVLKKIKTEKARISRLLAQDVSKIGGGQHRKDTTLRSMRKYLEELKIQADINDPMVKKQFEDGKGDLNKPIYRHLANEKWRSFRRKFLVQRIEQFAIVPDLLPIFDPSASVEVAFKRHKVQPGEYVDSRVSEFPARLKVQVFDKGERLVTVVMIDPDVPVVEQDNYIHKFHYGAVNIPISPTKTSIPLSLIQSPTQLVLPWVPPFAQKGTLYHRYSIFVLEQPEGTVIDVSELQQKIKRDNFSLRAFISQYHANPIGLGIFRSIWDEGTASVMHRASIEGADLVFKKKKVVALKPKEKPRGWEAKRAHPKYDAMLGKNRRPYRRSSSRR